MGEALIRLREVDTGRFEWRRRAAVTLLPPASARSAHQVVSRCDPLYGMGRMRRNLLVWPGRDQEVPQHLFHIFVVEKSTKELPQIGVCKGRCS
jgi:hypothetical protein